MPRFHKDRATLSTKRLVLAHVGAAQPAACGVIAVLVREHAVEHQDLFATPMSVRVEKRLWCPAHQGGVLRLKGVQWQNLQALHHALAPLAAARVDDHALDVARVQVAQFHNQMESLRQFD